MFGRLRTHLESPLLQVSMVRNGTANISFEFSVYVAQAGRNLDAFRNREAQTHCLPRTMIGILQCKLRFSLERNGKWGRYQWWRWFSPDRGWQPSRSWMGKCWKHWTLWPEEDRLGTCQPLPPVQTDTVSPCTVSATRFAKLPASSHRVAAAKTQETQLHDLPNMIPKAISRKASLGHGLLQRIPTILFHFDSVILAYSCGSWETFARLRSMCLRLSW